jgi:putative endonuclease
VSKVKLKIGDFVFVDSTKGNATLRDWQGRGYGVVTAVESIECEDVPFAQVLVNGELRWVLTEDISKDPLGNQWFLYVLECIDGTLYTGITTDPKRRLHEHNFTKKGAKYTRGRRPSKMIYCREFSSRSHAARLEYRFRKLSKDKKERVIQGKADISELCKL